MRASPTVETLSQALVSTLPSLREEAGRPCHCPACTTARATTYTCGACGYLGAPHLMPCTCDESRRLALTVSHRRLAEEELDSATRNALRSDVATALDDLGIVCDAATDRCSHAVACCPSCGAGSDEAEWEMEDPADRAHLWTLIRLMREALRARGIA